MVCKGESVFPHSYTAQLYSLNGVGFVSQLKEAGNLLASKVSSLLDFHTGNVAIPCSFEERFFQVTSHYPKQHHLEDV